MIPGGTLTSLYSNMKDCLIYILLHSPELSVKGLVFCVIVFVSYKCHDWIQSEKGEVNLYGVLKNEGMVGRVAEH